MARKWLLKKVREYNPGLTLSRIVYLCGTAGDFYGGWVTSELEGRMKGGPGTWGW